MISGARSSHSATTRNRDSSWTGAALRLTNVPIGTPDAVIREIESRRRWFDHSYTFGLLRGLTRVARGYTMPPADKPLPTDAMELNTRLLDQMRDVSRWNGAEFLLVYLSYGEGLFDPNLTEEGEEFLRNYGEHAHVRYLGHAACIPAAASR